MGRAEGQEPTRAAISADRRRPAEAESAPRRPGSWLKFRFDVVRAIVRLVFAKRAGKLPPTEGPPASRSSCRLRNRAKSRTSSSRFSGRLCRIPSNRSLLVIGLFLPRFVPHHIPTHSTFFRAVGEDDRMVAVYDLARPFGSLSGRQGSEGSWARPSPWPSPGGRGMRSCSPNSKPSPSSASTPCPSRSRSMSRPPACPRPSWSACPRRRSRRARIASSGRWSTRASSGRRTASSSTWPRPTCPRTPPRSICRSPWACWSAAGRSRPELLAEYAIVGELALDGSTRPTKGALSMAMAAAEARACAGCSCPAESAAEAAVVEGIEVIAVPASPRPSAFLTGEIEIEPDALAAGRPVPRACQPTTSISPTSAARRWPSGRSSSPPPAATIC